MSASLSLLAALVLLRSDRGYRVLFATKETKAGFGLLGLLKRFIKFSDSKPGRTELRVTRFDGTCEFLP